MKSMVKILIHSRKNMRWDGKGPQMLHIFSLKIIKIYVNVRACEMPQKTRWGWDEHIRGCEAKV